MEMFFWYSTIQEGIIPRSLGLSCFQKIVLNNQMFYSFPRKFHALMSQLLILMRLQSIGFSSQFTLYVLDSQRCVCILRSCTNSTNTLYLLQYNGLKQPKSKYELIISCALLHVVNSCPFQTRCLNKMTQIEAFILKVQNSLVWSRQSYHCLAKKTFTSLALVSIQIDV